LDAHPKKSFLTQPIAPADSANAGERYAKQIGSPKYEIQWKKFPVSIQRLFTNGWDTGRVIFFNISARNYFIQLQEITRSAPGFSKIDALITNPECCLI